jgi:SAM-dependent methyltransferase
MKKQPITAQIGEIEFRRKLYHQQVEGKRILNDELDAKGIENVLRNRMEETFAQMTSLKLEGIPLSPYIEIGAERCQRSLVMENDFGATGTAVDISYEMLKSCDYYKDIFNKDKVPLRICCDAKNMPFMTDSFPFVFCYATLHHFPDMTPVVKEIYRVLSPGGHFFFGGEPYKQLLHLNLYKRRTTSQSMQLSQIRKLMDYFLAEDNPNEVRYGIIENNNLPIELWEQVLSVFEERQLKLHSLKYLDFELFKPKNPIKFLLAYLAGGLISGICSKSGVSTSRNTSLAECLICPSCIENGSESILTRGTFSSLCRRCGQEFPIVDGVVFLFSDHKFRELYPEIFERIRHGVIAPSGLDSCSP